MGPARKTHFTEDEYLAVERASERKLELVAGELFIAGGGTPRHAAICANVARALGNALRDRPWVVLSSDQRVAVEATSMYTHPDVTVVCGPARFHPKDRNTVVNPTLVVEVLSDSTESHDRGTKLAHYRRLATLGEISSSSPTRSASRCTAGISRTATSRAATSRAATSRAATRSAARPKSDGSPPR